MNNKCRKLIFLLFSSSGVDHFVKKQNCRNLSLIPPLINGLFLPAILSTLIQRSKLALAMVSSHGFSFKNGSAISVTNDDRTLQWLLDFDWLLYIMSVFFDLCSPPKMLARKMRRNARESDNLFISSMYAPEMCNTSYTYQWKFISVSLLLQFIGTVIEKPGHWMKQQSHSS